MAEHAEPSSLEKKRHSLAHLLAAAVLEQFPDAQLAIGPAIDTGFYYDILFSRAITPDDLTTLQKTMRGYIGKKLPFSQTELPTDTAQEFFANQPFKLELIRDLGSDTVGISTFGNFTDLCRGGHVENTSDIAADAFVLHSLAGAYWRGSEKNAQLTRIYGLAFDTRAELDAHLQLLTEAKKRDHKVLGPQLGLFMFHETAPGMPYWLPNGMAVMNELLTFWRQEHGKRGYQEISSPLVNKKALWETSGHWEFYKDDMFIADMGDGEVYGIKPMNCPNAMVVFGSQLRSYKDLPLRLSDTDIIHRYERSGTLNGLLRVREFRQDDAHNFIREDQIEAEFGDILDIAKKFYGIFNLEYRLRLGTRPEKFLGEEKTWDTAEAALKAMLEKYGVPYERAEGDGAFYGPKVDILMKDCLGREWQMGTIQLDFQQPRRFNLSYIDETGKKQTPVVIHRVIYGSFDRFIGILIEHFAGAFPFWFASTQVAVLPVNENVVNYAAAVRDALTNTGLRTKVDERNEKIGKKIREAELQKIPVVLIVGQREADAQSVSVRLHGGTDLGVKKLDEVVTWLKEACTSRTLSLT